MTGRDFVEKIADEITKGDAEAARYTAIVYADWLEEKGLDSWAKAWRVYADDIPVLWMRHHNSVLTVAFSYWLSSFRDLLGMQWGESPLFWRFPAYQRLKDHATSAVIEASLYRHVGLSVSGQD